MTKAFILNKRFGQAVADLLGVLLSLSRLHVTHSVECEFRVVCTPPHRWTACDFTRTRRFTRWSGTRNRPYTKTTTPLLSAATWLRGEVWLWYMHGCWCTRVWLFSRLWIPLEPVTKEMGALEFYAGSHLDGKRGMVCAGRVSNVDRCGPVCMAAGVQVRWEQARSRVRPSSQSRRYGHAAWRCDHTQRLDDPPVMPDTRMPPPRDSTAPPPQSQR